MHRRLLACVLFGSACIGSTPGYGRGPEPTWVAVAEHPSNRRLLAVAPLLDAAGTRTGYTAIAKFDETAEMLDFGPDGTQVAEDTILVAETDVIGARRGHISDATVRLVTTPGRRHLALAFKESLRLLKRDGSRSTQGSAGVPTRLSFSTWSAIKELVAEREFNAPIKSAPAALRPLPDGTFVLAGTHDGGAILMGGVLPARREKDGFVLRFSPGEENADARISDVFTFAGHQDESVTDLATAADGSEWAASVSYTTYLRVNDTDPNLAETLGGDDAALVSITPGAAGGAPVLLATIAGPGHESGGRLARVADGWLWTARGDMGAAIGGTTLFSRTHLVAKVKDAGGVAWVRTIEGVNGDRPLVLAADPSGGALVGGNELLVRLDALGNVLWRKDGTDAIDAWSIIATEDGFVVAGAAIGPPRFGETLKQPATNVRGMLLALPL